MVVPLPIVYYDNSGQQGEIIRAIVKCGVWRITLYAYLFVVDGEVFFNSDAQLYALDAFLHSTLSFLQGKVRADLLS